MKKCPTCEKTFEDNLRFCQTDGTPLVDAVEEPTDDPYKTIVAGPSDLTPIPDDPYKTIVAGMPSAGDSEPPEDDVSDVLELAEESEVESVDPLRTIIASDVKEMREQADEVTDEVNEIEPAPDTPPPSPFSVPALSKENESSGPVAERLGDMSSPAPEPPKFSEPDISPPNFADERQSPPAETGPESPEDDASTAVEVETEAVPHMEAPEESGSQSSELKEFSEAPPLGNTENMPIPSPFDNSMPPGYQAPSTPMPAYQESDQGSAPPNPFDQPEGAGQPLQEMGWSPPPPPESGWQDQQIGQKTPFQPPMSGAGGQNQTLAIVSLVLGALSIVFCLGFLSGIPAIITGYIARKNESESPALYGGGTMAMIGMILGGIGAVLSILSIAAWIIIVLMANI